LQVKLAKKNAEVAKLKAQINPMSVFSGTHVPVKGDKVDIAFCGMLNEMNLTLPSTRMQEGTYMFGTAKIFGTIKNKTLMIRNSAGAVMEASDFLANFASKEAEKCKRKNL